MRQIIYTQYVAFTQYSVQSYNIFRSFSWQCFLLSYSYKLGLWKIDQEIFKLSLSLEGILEKIWSSKKQQSESPL